MHRWVANVAVEERHVAVEERQNETVAVEERQNETSSECQCEVRVPV